MKSFGLKHVAVLCFACFALLASDLQAADKAAAVQPLSAEGQKLETKYANQLKTLQAEISKSLPKISEQQQAAFKKSQAAFKAAEVKLEAAQKSMGEIGGAKGLVEHAKGKWLGGAEKGIKQAEEALKKAKTEDERNAAKKDLAKWQADKEAGLKALKERQLAYDKLKANEPKVSQMLKDAQAEINAAKADQEAAVKVLLKAAEPALANDKLDAALGKSFVIAEATPRGLAEYAVTSKESETLVDKLLADTALMLQMLEAGGARHYKYGKAMEIYSAIQKISPKSKEGSLQRLALAVSLEHAKPIVQSNIKTQTKSPYEVDPVKRYLHYEKAFQDGELDPAFKDFTVWEYRMIVDCDAPDEILAWGREMLRNYRPDHVFNPDYGWRYSGAVRTEVAYGSQNLIHDLDSLHQYQNIIKDGGVCGRRAFFGRFILQSFGIPTWGVTQHKHAAVGHWTPKGWVVNLGAGFEHSWWDKDETPRSGSEFLLESQARVHQQEYFQVLRANWISKALGEQSFNDRKNIDGGFWSNLAHHKTLLLASTAVKLGPLGQELAEANEAKSKQAVSLAKVGDADKKIIKGQGGEYIIPAVGYANASGHFSTMKSYDQGTQLHGTGGFKGDYVVELPQAGKYALTALVVTVHEGQKFQVLVNDSKAAVDVPIPYTLGEWQKSKPVEFSLQAGKNMLNIKLADGAAGVSIKEFRLTPVK